MKTIILLCVLTFGFLSISYSQEYEWKDISTNIPQTGEYPPDLSDVYFISDNEGWITSNSHAEIYHTNDGGETFEIQTTQFPCNAIHMINVNEGYAGGASGRVYRTTDGGEIWIAIGSIGVTLTDISFPPTGDTGYACGDSGAEFSIDSTGVTNLNSPSSSTFRGISAPSVNNVWVCGGNRIYYYNGTDFTSQIAPPGSFNDIHFINNQEGWVVGDNGVIGHTTDGGAGWATQTNPDNKNSTLIGVFFMDSNNGWAVGAYGVILHTIDGGTSWIVEGAGHTSVALSGVHFTSSTNGYIVGNNKTLLKYTEVSGIGDNVENIKFEIYPNPAKNTIQIQCTAFKTESGIIEILSLDSKKILEKEIETGIENIELDLKNLETGMYFCKITIDNRSSTKKIIKE